MTQTTFADPAWVERLGFPIACTIVLGVLLFGLMRWSANRAVTSIDENTKSNREIGEKLVDLCAKVASNTEATKTMTELVKGLHASVEDQRFKAMETTIRNLETRLNVFVAEGRAVAAAGASGSGAWPVGRESGRPRDEDDGELSQRPGHRPPVSGRRS